MKKLLFALLLTTMVPLSTFAVSLSELQTNTNRYTKVFEEYNYTVYVEDNTIQSLRYAPPYYTIKCTYYIAGYSSNYIFEIPSTFNYNYNRNKNHIFSTVIKSSTSDQIDKNLVNEAMINSGMQYGLTTYKYYNLAGDYLGDANSNKTGNCEPNSAPYAVANYLFEKCYNEKFAFDFQHN